MLCAAAEKKRGTKWDKWDNAKPFVFNKNLVPTCPTLGQNGTKMGQTRFRNYFVVDGVL
jgi:hypothetical protein